METLSPDDYRRILKAIEILGSADDYARFPQRALDAILVGIDVDFASYSEVDLAAGRNRFLVKPDLGEMRPGSQPYTRLVRRFGNHPILAHRLSTQAPADPEFESFLRRVRLMGMVGNCCGEAELLLNLELMVENMEGRMIGISINRSIRDFEPRDTQSLETLKPHIVAAYRIAVRLEGPAHAGSDVGGMVSGLPLTTRENQVLYWVSMGKTNEEVGMIVGARPLTIKKHLEHIYDKLGVPNRTAAARMLKAQTAFS